MADVTYLLIETDVTDDGFDQQFCKKLQLLVLCHRVMAGAVCIEVG